MKTLFISLAIFICACSNQDQDIKAIEEIGKAFMENDSLNPHPPNVAIVTIGPGVLNKLSEIKSNLNSYHLEVSKGDLDDPFGNNEADYILIIRNNYDDIAIRLQKSGKDEKYNILGWLSLKNYNPKI
jgi:hypothetical protein